MESKGELENFRCTSLLRAKPTEPRVKNVSSVKYIRSHFKHMIS